MKPLFSMCHSWLVATAAMGPKPLWATLVVSSLLLLSSCNTPGETATGSSANSPSATAEAVSPDATTDAEANANNGDGGATSLDPNPTDASGNEVTADSTLISATGIGPAQLGVTVGALKKLLGNGVQFKAQSPFLSDFDAIAVQQGDQTLFYLLYLAGDPLDDEDVILGILTTNPRYQTGAGVGVGTPIQTAEAAYGNATLSHNTDNESREYVRFERHPATNLSFTTQPVPAAADGSLPPFAGTYANSAVQYNETEEYQADASLQAVLLVCLSVSCSQGQ
ncbi:MAG: hypothetical protein VKJ64_07055 [Leptolyngbyaceae bacterium]|nr:hypothetical protein [Leptolyngbyaceae bacterium]